LHVVVKRGADEAGAAAFELQRMPPAEPEPKSQPGPPKVPEIERLLKVDLEYIKDIERLLEKDVEGEPEPEPEPPKEPEIELLIKTLADQITGDERTHKQKEGSKKARGDAKAAEPNAKSGVARERRCGCTDCALCTAWLFTAIESGFQSFSPQISPMRF
jgi:hypothetical protein